MITTTSGRFVYAIGGFNGITRMNSGERYNPLNNTWTNIMEMYSPRSNFGIEVGGEGWEWVGRGGSGWEWVEVGGNGWIKGGGIGCWKVLERAKS